MRHAKEYTRKGSHAKTALFFALLILTMIVSLILPLRPAVSNLEQRELKKFPDFSLESLQSGAYFKGIDDWFADTFPGRDLFFQVNKVIRSFYGIQTVEIVGAIEQGDDIPTAPFTGNDENSKQPEE